MRTPRLSRSVVTSAVGAPALALIAAVTLTACSGSDSADPKASLAAASRSAAAVTTAPDGSYGAKADLVSSKCTTDGSTWSFVGQVKNSQKDTQSYTVSISVVDNKTYTVLGSKTITTKVEGGKQAEVKADKFATTKVKEVQCVPRVTRKPA